jgi:hypothetical protein
LKFEKSPNFTFLFFFFCFFFPTMKLNTHVSWLRIDRYVLQKWAANTGEELYKTPPRKRLAKLVELLTGDEALQAYARAKVKNRHKKKTKTYQIEHVDEVGEDRDDETVVAVRRGKHQSRIRDKLVQLGISDPRAGLVAACFAETIFADIAVRQEAVVHVRASISAFQSRLVLTLEETRSLPANVIDEINTLDGTTGMMSEADVGILLTGLLCGSSVLWRDAVVRLEAERIRPKSKSNRIFLTIPVLKIVQSAIAPLRDHNRALVGRIESDLASNIHYLGQQRAKMARRLDDDPLQQKSAVKQLRGGLSKHHLYQEMAAWRAPLEHELAAIARLSRVEDRRALITPSLLARLRVGIAFSNVAVRQSGWIRVSCAAARAALADPDKIIVFQHHKTSKTHGPQLVALCETAQALLRRYLDTVRPLLPAGDGDLLFVTARGVQMQALDVRQAFAATPMITVPEVQRAWTEQREHFTSTALRKLFTDEPKTEQEQRETAENQCHSAAVFGKHYAAEQRAAERRRIAVSQLGAVRGASGVPTMMVVEEQPPTMVVKDQPSMMVVKGTTRCARFDWARVEQFLLATFQKTTIEMLDSLPGSNKCKAKALQGLLRTDPGMHAIADMLEGKTVRNKFKNEAKRIGTRG